MFCDVLIRDVEDLFGDLVEVYVVLWCSELGKVSDFCSVKMARCKMIIWLDRTDGTYRCGFPTTTSWVRELVQVGEGGLKGREQFKRFQS
jgi:hypothetical protein